MKYIISVLSKGFNRIITKDKIYIALKKTKPLILLDFILIVTVKAYALSSISSTARITTPATRHSTKTAAAEELNERLKNRLLRFAEQPVLRAC